MAMTDEVAAGVTTAAKKAPVIILVRLQMRYRTIELPLTVPSSLRLMLFSFPFKPILITRSRSEESEMLR